jgi:hypothetical protein
MKRSEHHTAHAQPMLETLEPRLLLDGWVDYAFVDRLADYETPEAPDEYAYAVRVEGDYFYRMELTTPWGESFDSADYLTEFWDGSDFAFGDATWWFEGGYDWDWGVEYFTVGWDALTGPQWAALETGASWLDVTHDSGTWSAMIDFLGAPQPPEPILIDPVHGQVDVPLQPSVQWEPWADPPTPDAGEISVELFGPGLPDDYYEILAPDAVGWDVPAGVELQGDTEYELGLSFASDEMLSVGDAFVMVSSRALSDAVFTTEGEAGPISELWVFRAIDYELPGPGDDSFEYGVDMTGAELTGVAVTTPWGEPFDSADYLPPGWAGEEFWTQVGQLEIYADSWEEGRYIEVQWNDLSTAQWAALDTGATDLTITYVGGSWQGLVDFTGVTQPTQVPTLLDPVHGQTGVPLQPTIRWEPWASPPPGTGEIELCLVDQERDEGVFDDLLEVTATQSTVPAPLEAGVTYEVELCFYSMSFETINGQEVTVEAATESDPLFTTFAGATEVWMDRGIEYEVPGRDDDYLSYLISVDGYGLDRLRITTPWGRHVDTDLLPVDLWAELADGEGASIWLPQGALGIDLEQDDDGLMMLEVCWDGLTDLQWASLDTGRTHVIVDARDGSSWTAALDFAGVEQIDLEPWPVSPIHRDFAPNDLTVEWLPWDDPPANADIYVEIEERPANWYHTGNEYSAEGLLPATATSWTPPPLPNSDGIFEMELSFGELAEDTIGGVPVTTAAYTMNVTTFVVGGPEAFLRTDEYGWSYFLTPAGSWDECQWFAESYGGNLVTIVDADHEAWLQEEYGSDECFWTGFNDIDQEGNWVWVSGEPVTYTNWAAGQPSAAGDEDAAVMNWPRGEPWSEEGETAEWNDYPRWSWYRGIAELGPGSVPDLADDHANIAELATHLALPDETTGWLSSFGDIDFFSFEAAAGQTYEILVELPDGGLGDSTLWLYDADGITLLTWDDDGGHSGLGSRILWVAGDDGVYYVAVDSYELVYNAYETGEYTLTIEASSFTPETPAGTFPHPAEEMSFPTDRGTAVSDPTYTGATSGYDLADLLHFLHLGDPLAPTEVAAYVVGDWAGAAAGPDDAYAYVADNSNAYRWPGQAFSELVVVEIVAAGDAREVTRVRLAHPNVDALAGQGELLYALTQNAGENVTFLEVYSVAGDPTRPAFLGQGPPVPRPPDGYYGAEGLLVHGDRAYALFGDPGWVVTFDVSNPAAPAVLGDYLLTGPDAPMPSSMAADGDLLWVTTGWELQAIDFADPAGATLVSSLPLDGRGGDVVLGNGLAFVGTAATGGCVVDVSDPADPQIVRSYAVPGATGALAVYGGYAYVPTYGRETAVLVATLPGDVDGDGQTDFLDYLAVKTNYGLGSGATWHDGDFDADGDVDLDDYLTGNDYYGRSLSAGGAEVLAVPGPAAPDGPLDADPAPGPAPAADVGEAIPTGGTIATVSSAGALRAEPAPAPVSAAPLVTEADAAPSDADAPQLGDSLDVLSLAELLPLRS